MAFTRSDVQADGKVVVEDVESGKPIRMWPIDARQAVLMGTVRKLGAAVEAAEAAEPIATAVAEDDFEDDSDES